MFPKRVVYEGRDFAPVGRNKNVAFTYPHGEQSVL